MNTTNLRKGLAFACLGLLLAAPALRAHDTMEGMDGKGGAKAQAKMLEKMKTDLDLSDGQSAQMKTECASDLDAAAVLHEKMVMDVDKLRVLVDQKAGADELKTAIALVKDDKAALASQMAKHMDAMQEILTPLQQAKAILMMAEHKQHDKGPHGPKDGDKDEDKDGK